MADPAQPSQQEVSAATSTVTTVLDEENQVDVPTVTVKLKKPRTDRKVQWTTETIDNEEMNKKKSKCCCVYKKPTVFGESSSSESSDEECDHCQGHVEKKKTKHSHAEHQDQHGHAGHKHESNGTSAAQSQPIPEGVMDVIRAISEFPEPSGIENPGADNNPIQQSTT